MNYSRYAWSLRSRIVCSLALIVSGFLTGCEGGSSTTSSPTYTVGGTVVNLAGTGGGLQLQDNDGDAMLVNANGSFTFGSGAAPGSTYSVTVSTQPSSPVQICEVTHGTGTATADVTSVAVDCGHGEWTWMGGSNTSSGNNPPTYGILGTPAPDNIPGARTGGVTWTDAAGNFWLFGGSGVANSSGNIGSLNDLWRYSAGEWTWMDGSNQINQGGTYGTQGTPAPGNIPGGRDGGAAWTDTAGNFWLFGGGYNDLWEYSAGQWTWVGGYSNASFLGLMGTYGTEGTPAPANLPWGRVFGATWTDKSGNFWLFGGSGAGPLIPGVNYYLNDLWKYSGGQWTWVDGSNSTNQVGAYGTEGIPAAGNIPGARYGGAAWTDPAGNFWLFGGSGWDSTGNFGALNDLWRYSTGQWTWMGGSKLVGQSGTYGTEGAPAPGNVPGARSSAMTWTDAAGNFWLFGGSGADSTGNFGSLNDLWKYSAGQWTWMGGSKVVGQSGTYGTEGAPAPGNVPGARGSAMTWTDSAGNLWLFAGAGMDSGTNYIFNELWRYEP